MNSDRSESSSLTFNPIDPATRRDPFAIYARGRAEQPVLAHPALGPDAPRLYSLFRYDDVQRVLRDPETFSSEFPRPQLPDVEEPPPSMLLSDGERHHRLRSLVNKAFTPRIVGGLESHIRSVTQALVDDALERDEVDWVEALSYPLPVQIIAEMIGVPVEDRARFKAWSDEVTSTLGNGFFGATDLDAVRAQRERLAEMRQYFVPLAEARRAAPRDDLLSGLVRAEHEGSRLSHDEMLQMLVLILVAGNETTTTLINNTTLALLLRPEIQATLRARPECIPGAIEEVLRLESPIQFDPRLARDDVEIAGTKIPAGAVVLCWLGSANRDEAAFDRAAVFDVDRTRNAHLAFGFGVHYCLGANLARLEARIATEVLLERTRRFERVGDEALPLHASPVFRTVTRLPLRLEAA